MAAIESLISRRGTFDYVLLETSGLADPGNLAPLFWVDEGLGSSIYLDGIVTLVDAKNVLLSLNESPSQDAHQAPHLTTAHLQISHADVIIINKSDTVTPSQLEAIEKRIKAINGLATLHITHHSQVPRLEGFLLDLHAYDGLEALDTASKGHSHLDPVSLLSLSPPLFPLLKTRCNTHHSFPLFFNFFKFIFLKKDNLNPHASPPDPIPLTALIPRILAPSCSVGNHAPAPSLRPAKSPPTNFRNPPAQRPRFHLIRRYEDDPGRSRCL